MDDWFRENGMLLIAIVLATGVVAFGIDRCSEYQKLKLETNREIKMNKAEEGHKFKFGLTKEQ